MTGADGVRQTPACGAHLAAVQLYECKAGWALPQKAILPQKYTILPQNGRWREVVGDGGIKKARESGPSDNHFARFKKSTQGPWP